MRKIVLADPKYGPVNMLKIDIADGFYRVGLSTDDIPKLGVVFPSEDGAEQLVALPLTLPMGWTNSPPIFCAATETVADLANQRILKGRKPPRHRLDDVANTPPEAHPPSPARPPRPALAPRLHLPPAVPEPDRRDPNLHHPRRHQLAAIDVYVDDFIGIAQGADGQLQRIRRVLLEALDDVFRPLDGEDSPYRSEPASVKKLRQGDGCWATVKQVWGGF